MEPVTLTVFPDNLALQLVNVELAFWHAGGARLLWMPEWIPGSYLLRDYARHVHNLQACDARGQSLALDVVDGSSWRLQADAGPVRLRYRVLAAETSVRGNDLTPERCFLNPVALCLCVEGCASQAHQLHLPAEAWPAEHRVATSLPPLACDASGFGCYQADSYDALVDAPVLIAPFEEFVFHVGQVAHRVVLSGCYRADLGRLQADMQAIVQAEFALFDPAGSLDGQYLFMMDVVASGGGGLEHEFNTALTVPRHTLPRPGQVSASRDYIRLLGLISHEYFHRWNVKRIRPRALLPYRLRGAQRFDTLWFFEGVTSYYDDLMLHRAGLLDAEGYLRLLSEHFSALYQRGAWRHQSLVAASQLAWDRYYKLEARNWSLNTDYYGHGALIALALDLSIRLESQGRHSLDDVMRDLWREAQAPGYAGVTQALLARQVAAYAGEALVEQLHDWLHEPGVLPDWAALLAPFGVALHWREPADENGACLAALGAWLNADGRLLRVTRLVSEETGSSGLMVGDEIVAVDGVCLDMKGLRDWLARCPPDATLTLHVLRRSTLIVLPVTLLPLRAWHCRLEMETVSTPFARQWLRRDE